MSAVQPIACLKAFAQVVKNGVLCKRRQRDHIVISTTMYCFEESVGISFVIAQSHAERVICWVDRHPTPMSKRSLDVARARADCIHGCKHTRIHRHPPTQTCVNRRTLKRKGVLACAYEFA
eukprot:6175410-Pleurochrysis_carterae.AAC.3